MMYDVMHSGNANSSINLFFYTILRAFFSVFFTAIIIQSALRDVLVKLGTIDLEERHFVLFCITKISSSFKLQSFYYYYYSWKVSGTQV